MKALKVALAASVAAALLSGCCCPLKTKCYPYPLYDYSPAKVCGTACAPACAPACPPPCAPACAPACR